MFDKCSPSVVAMRLNKGLIAPQNISPEVPSQSVSNSGEVNFKNTVIFPGSSAPSQHNRKPLDRSGSGKTVKNYSCPQSAVYLLTTSPLSKLDWHPLTVKIQAAPTG